MKKKTTKKNTTKKVVKSNVERVKTLKNKTFKFTPKSKKKKYLRKNEFRMDINTLHLNSKQQPHPAYISAKYGHKLKANSITHSRTINGAPNYVIDENPDKQNQTDKRVTRISPPFWQSEKQFGSKLENFKFSKKARRKISKINNKHK